ncbi:MAG: ABC transporter substrate-binding protein, partial [Clostridia bacterium]|nr:ABC transporter substrate-binding protein [Clostridia bacterium]
MKKITSIILLVAMLLLCGCGAQKQPEQGLGSLKKVNSMELSYANMFSVDYYEGGYKLITIADEDQYLVVPKGAEVPKGISSDVAVLKQPIENIYLAASASMCLFDALNRLDS